MIKCPKCEETKDVKEFGKNNSTKNGYKTYCKSCCVSYNSKYTKAYAEKNKAVHLNKQSLEVSNDK